ARRAPAQDGRRNASGSWIAVALALRPHLLLLDEPTAVRTAVWNASGSWVGSSSACSGRPSQRFGILDRRGAGVAAASPAARRADRRQDGRLERFGILGRLVERLLRTAVATLRDPGSPWRWRCGRISCCSTSRPPSGRPSGTLRDPGSARRAPAQDGRRNASGSWIAVALALRPHLLLLDEPTAVRTAVWNASGSWVGSSSACSGRPSQRFGILDRRGAGVAAASPAARRADRRQDGRLERFGILGRLVERLLRTAVATLRDPGSPWRWRCGRISCCSTSRPPFLVPGSPWRWRCGRISCCSTSRPPFLVSKSRIPEAVRPTCRYA